MGIFTLEETLAYIKMTLSSTHVNETFFFKTEDLYIYRYAGRKKSIVLKNHDFLTFFTYLDFFNLNQVELFKAYSLLTISVIT